MPRRERCGPTHLTNRAIDDATQRTEMSPSPRRYFLAGHFSVVSHIRELRRKPRPRFRRETFDASRRFERETNPLIRPASEPSVPAN